MYSLNKNLNIISIIMILIGVMSLSIGFINDAHGAWVSLLF